MGGPSQPPGCAEVGVDRPRHVSPERPRNSQPASRVGDKIPPEEGAAHLNGHGGPAEPDGQPWTPASLAAFMKEHDIRPERVPDLSHFRPVPGPTCPAGGHEDPGGWPARAAGSRCPAPESGAQSPSSGPWHQGSRCSPRDGRDFVGPAVHRDPDRHQPVGLGPGTDPDAAVPGPGPGRGSRPRTGRRRARPSLRSVGRPPAPSPGSIPRSGPRPAGRRPVPGWRARESRSARTGRCAATPR